MRTLSSKAKKITAAMLTTITDADFINATSQSEHPLAPIQPIGADGLEEQVG
jgi:hypothetical protein